MLNKIWSGMIILGIVYGIFSGNSEAVSKAIVDYTGQAVSLCVSMMGIVAFWTGIMEVAKEAGLIRKLTAFLQPFISLLFPNLPRDSRAMDYMGTNIIANILGLGWACTPAGLRAMEELAELNGHKEEASDDMCAFLILNISSLQLIPVNMIAYRNRYGAKNPTAIILPTILATICSTLAGVLFIKIFYGRWGKDDI